MFPTITAHTGCENTAENTIESAVEGIAAGADFVEVDVRTASDGVPVLSHEDGIVTKSGLSLRISGSSSVELVQQIPSIVKLETLLIEILPSGKSLNIDIKDERSLVPVYSMVKKHGAYNQVVITGCNIAWARTIAAFNPALYVYLNTKISIWAGMPFVGRRYITSLCKLVVSIGCRGLNLHKAFYSPQLVQIAHEHGLSISVWTVSENDGFDKYVTGGVDNITTKDVSALVSYRTSSEKR